MINKNMNMSRKFIKYDNEILSTICEKIMVEMVSSDVFGEIPDQFDDGLENRDSYATGDNRFPKILGVYSRNGLKKSKNKKRKRNKRSK